MTDAESDIYREMEKSKKLEPKIHLRVGKTEHKFLLAYTLVLNAKNKWRNLKNEKRR